MKINNFIKNKYILYFFIASIFFIWLWVFRFNSINSPFMRDEGEYAYSAQLLHDGGVPYKESFMLKPPMIIYTYYLAQKISQDFWAPRLLALVSIFFTALILADILRKKYNFKTAIVFLALFSPMISFPLLEGFFAQPEIFLLLPFAISFWCFFKWCDTQKNIWLIIIGFFSAVSILYKPIIFPALLFLFFYILFFNGKDSHNDWKQIFYRNILFLIGGILSLFVILLPIILKGGIWYMWESTFLYNLYYSKISGFHLGSFLYLLSFWWPVLLLCIWFFIKSPKNKLLFLGILLGCFIGTAGASLLHYYLIIVPILSIICAIALVNLVENLKSLRTEREKYSCIIFIIFIITILLIYPFKEIYFFDSKNFVNNFFNTPFGEAVVVSNELKKITIPTDEIFIFGNEPEILYYSHRKSITRFVIIYPIEIDTPLSKKYEAELIKSLKNNPPKVIITGKLFFNKKKLNHSNDNDSYVEFIVHMLLKNYNFVGQAYSEDEINYKFDNVYNKKNIKENSLFLYKLKN